MSLERRKPNRITNPQPQCKKGIMKAANQHIGVLGLQTGHHQNHALIEMQTQLKGMRTAPNRTSRLGFSARIMSALAFSALMLLLAAPLESRAQSFTPTGMATLNGTTENSITLSAGADLSGSFPYLAADGASAGQNMITVVGLVNSANQWVGGAPQVVYNGVPSQSGTSGTAPWSDLVVPSSPGTYQLWFQTFLTANATGSINAFESSPPTASGNLAGIVATVIVGASPSFTPTAMATLNGTQENSITLTPSAGLSGVFPCLAADGASAGQNMITVIGLVNSANQWVGGAPQVVYNGVPSSSGTSGTASWSDLVVPSAAGTYQLWFQTFLTANPTGSINAFESSPPTTSGNLAGIVATVIVGASPSFTPTATATLNGTQENSITLTPSADLSGSFPYLAADGASAGQNMITVIGLVTSANQWVGGAPQIVYNGVPSPSGTSGTASWSDLVVPSGAGTYQLWFQSFLTTDASGSTNSFEYSPPTASGNLAGIVATVVVQGGSPPPSGLLAYYPFDGNANDASGNGNNATTYGSPSYAPGAVSFAACLNGVDDGFDCPVNLEVCTNVTIAFWLKVLSYPADQRYQLVGNDAGHYGRIILLSGSPQYSEVFAPTNGLLYMFFADYSRGWSSTFSPQLQLNTWYHVAGVWTPDTTSLYLNGTLTFSEAGSIDALTYDSMDVRIGLPTRNETPPLGHYSTDYADGCFGDVRIYGRALSAAEIQQLAQGAGPQPPMVVTSQATNITANSVTLSGTINPNGLPTTAYFQWGTTTNYGNTVPNPPISCGSGTTTIGFGVPNLTGLTPNTTYHYQLVANNSAGTSYGGDQTFTTPSGGAPPVTISSAYSSLTLTPGSAQADGSSSITAAATLRDVNNNPVSGRTIAFRSLAHLTMSNPSNTTDVNGQANTTITTTTPGTFMLILVDLTNNNIVASVTGLFTQQGYVLPNSTLSNAIATLYQESAGSLVSEGGISISSFATNAGGYGDYFRSQITADKASAVIDAAFAVFGAAIGIPDDAQYAQMLAQPGDLVEVDTGLIGNTQLSYLLDSGLYQGVATTRLLESGLWVAAQEALQEGGQQAADWSEQFVNSTLANLAGAPNGLSSLANQAATSCTNAQQDLLGREQALFATGIPTSIDQNAWAADLQARWLVSYTFGQVLNQQNQFLAEVYAVRQSANQPNYDLLLAQFGLDVAAGLMGDGPGALLVGGIFTLADEYKIGRNLSSDQASYNAAFSLLSGCLQYSGQIYMNTANAYREVGSTLRANPVTAQISSMTDWEEGYLTWGPLHLQWALSVTNAYSLLEVQNTGSGAACFEVFALSSYSGAAYGATVGNLLQVSQNAVVIPGQTSAEIPIVYYDGHNGAKPGTAFPMEIYVLGNNAYGTFYVGAINSHNWSPTMITNGSARQLYRGGKPGYPGPGPMDTNSVIDFENPVTTYVSQKAANQSYQAQIFVVNPFTETYSAIVTQALPPGITVLTTDGMVEGDSIVWTNTVTPTNVVEDTFSFTLAAIPGASTNLGPPTVVYFDQTNNQSSPFYSTVPGFNGILPVQATASIPQGTAGVDALLPVTITNLTGSNQTGSLIISIADPLEPV